MDPAEGRDGNGKDPRSAISCFIAGAKNQPSDAGSAFWLVRAENGWVSVNPAWVALLEEKVAEGPPYEGGIYPPVHHYTDSRGNQGSNHYTLDVARMTR